RSPADFFTPVPWKLADLKRVLSRWDAALGDAAWASQYLGNHDLPRMVSRFGEDNLHRVVSAKMLATLLLTLRGTPFVYQGDELGMTNYPFSKPEEFRDLQAVRALREGAGLATQSRVSRDHARTPVQWDASPHAGFTTGTPWIAVHPDYPRVNAEAALREPDSVFHHYRKLIALRREHPVLIYGSFQELPAPDQEVYRYRRSLEGVEVTVELNFSGREVALAPPAGTLLLGNYPDLTPALRAYEGRLFLSATGGTRSPSPAG
ncbi:MAG: alpha-amylase family glycosyl hydrolase, partial [Candidatus Eremiobacterota bacterium]